jgi:hypothetical protein
MKCCFLLSRLSLFLLSLKTAKASFFGISKARSVLVFPRNITNLSNLSADHHVNQMVGYSSREATGS